MGGYRLTPSLDELKQEHSHMSWGGCFSISKDYYSDMTKVRHSASWFSSLEHALEKLNTSEYWMALLYRTQDSVYISYFHHTAWARFFGYVGFDGEFRLFKNLLPLREAVRTAFKEQGLV